MLSNNGLAATFTEWMLAQQIAGYETTCAAEGRVRITGENHVGEVNLYDLEDEPQPVVEMRIMRRADEEHVFFLHFMLSDLLRAQELFGEMTDALAELASPAKTRVLLSCTCGITTTMFASKMNELAAGLGLPYEVQAKPLDRVIAEAEPFDAVMLAPQVAYERPKVAAAYPQAVVFEIPARIFGSYDANGAMRLLNNALDGHNRAAEAPHDPAKLPSDLSWKGRIMVVTAVLGSRQSTFEYRVVEDGDVILTGTSAKRTFSFRDVEDLLAGVRLQGVDVGKLDAIGIAVPGIVSDEQVSLLMEGVRDYDLGGHIQAAYHVPVYLDNDANAAAVGCYTVQKAYRSITYHRESFGHSGGGQGMVLDGRLHTGAKNFAGEVNHLINAMRFSADPADLAWTEAGMYELVSRWVLVNSVQYAPEAIYVDAWPVTDMARVRAEVAQFMDERYIPELLVAPDFTESTLLGELALCVQRLRAQG